MEEEEEQQQQQFVKTTGVINNIFKPKISFINSNLKLYIISNHIMVENVGLLKLKVNQGK